MTSSYSAIWRIFVAHRRCHGSLHPERFQRIGIRGSSRRNEARSHHAGRQNDGNSHKGQRISWPHAVQKTSQKPGHCQWDDDSDHNAHASKRDSVAKDDLEDVLSRSLSR